MKEHFGRIAMLEASQPITENGTQRMPQLSKFTGCFEAVACLFIRVDKRDISKRFGMSGAI